MKAIDLGLSKVIDLTLIHALKWTVSTKSWDEGRMMSGNNSFLFASVKSAWMAL